MEKQSVEKGVIKMKKEESNVNLLIESVEAGLMESQFDNDNLTLRNVCLLGPTSRNGRRYPHEVIRESLAMFLGCKAYLNHPSMTDSRSNRCRDVRDLIGKYENPRIEEGKLRADLRILPHFREMIHSLATQMPDAVGLSINARGRTCMREGVEIIERIIEVRSVDLVTDPAATDGLFESMEKPNDTEVKHLDWKKLNIEEIKQHRPDLLESVQTPLLEQIRDLKQENQKVQKEARIQACLRRSGLPETSVSPVFVRQLQEAETEDQIKALIEDRAQVLDRSRNGGPELREKSVSMSRSRPSDDEMYGRRI